MPRVEAGQKRWARDEAETALLLPRGSLNGISPRVAFTGNLALSSNRLVSRTTGYYKKLFRGRAPDELDLNSL